MAAYKAYKTMRNDGKLEGLKESKGKVDNQITHLQNENATLKTQLGTLTDPKKMAEVKDKMFGNFTKLTELKTLSHDLTSALVQMDPDTAVEQLVRICNEKRDDGSPSPGALKAQLAMENVFKLPRNAFMKEEVDDGHGGKTLKPLLGDQAHEMAQGRLKEKLGMFWTSVRSAD